MIFTIHFGGNTPIFWETPILGPSSSTMRFQEIKLLAFPTSSAGTLAFQLEKKHKTWQKNAPLRTSTWFFSVYFYKKWIMFLESLILMTVCYIFSYHDSVNQWYTCKCVGTFFECCAKKWLKSVIFVASICATYLRNRLCSTLAGVNDFRYGQCSTRERREQYPNNRCFFWNFLVNHQGF